ncbi:bifunctional precorrin-2 dehydrogenase/sirohydrochlorin ferrochelatase [Halorubrum sp. JWXQ-INN 858]|uniref:precorrin-2 dehydrogenase/sirohydrochlorin ferrochelatase family protein n=1 Tax=Halorubrum sp. JWXQ-INN 858 TaxID=2690782 RepID=UPI0013596824|nr:NAD(P)-dependent oxidoreductase [Halorubrum sp. JWXQ-INN 858]MWV64228.1 bifunctional precorrin-2 dehydrogenase/sirohydrochlorin ferrochelatase [Halorubrum sp. JWXQ-INN 858]
MIPLFHDFDDETVLVFGGGGVGARKARRFAREARVVVVSPTFDPGLLASAAGTGSGVELVRAAPASDDVETWVEGAAPALVVAATDDPAINAAAEAAARAAGALVNRTDAAGGRDAGSVVVPATVDDDPVRVAISTGGASPALAKALRERVEAEIDGAGAMADLSGELRADLKRRGVAPGKRRDAVRAVVRSDGVWKALQEGRSKGAQEAQKVIEEVLRA